MFEPQGSAGTRNPTKVSTQKFIKLEFRAACSAAYPELGAYTQWVRWRAPTKKNKEAKQKERMHTRMAVRDARYALVHSLMA